MLSHIEIGKPYLSRNLKGKIDTFECIQQLYIRRYHKQN